MGIYFHSSFHFRLLLLFQSSGIPSLQIVHVPSILLSTSFSILLRPYHHRLLLSRILVHTPYSPDRLSTRYISSVFQVSSSYICPHLLHSFPLLFYPLFLLLHSLFHYRISFLHSSIRYFLQ